MSGNVHAYVRKQEMARLCRWAVREAACEVDFITTADGWRIALSHYRGEVITQPFPVLLCHGLGSNRLAFDTDEDYSLAAWLAAQGFDVYAVDLRGHGLSEKPVRGGKRWGWGFNDYCTRDIPAAIDAVLARTGRRQLHFMGHSMGGLLLYARAALQDTRIKSGIAIGASLDYSGLPTLFRAIAPLVPLSRLLPFVPIHWAALLSSHASALSPAFVDPSLAVARNVDVRVYRKMTANVLHPVSAAVLRDLAQAINGQGLRTMAGDRYDDLLKKNGYPFPVLAVAGSADLQCPPATAARFGTAHRIFGKCAGHQEDYSHHDLLMGLRAEQEVWPVMQAWLESASA